MDENVGDTDQVDEVLTKLKAYCMAAIGEMFLLNDIIMELLFGDSDKATYNQILVDTDEREVTPSSKPPPLSRRRILLISMRNRFLLSLNQLN
ncbi:hypothetical protein Aperf_G00000128284 [Anoplocephala perfoliata]